MRKDAVYGIILAVCLSIPSFAALQNRGVSPAVSKENQPLMVEAYRIRISNTAEGAIDISEDKGNAWQQAGKVIQPANQVSDQGYTASMWVDDGDVAAVAVNSIHIKTDFNVIDDRGVIFSISPKENAFPKNSGTGSTTISTDINSGSGIFGGGFSPLVGNKVATVDAKGIAYPIGRGFKPSSGDTFLIIVERPAKYPKEIIFENRFGGLIQIKYLDGEKRYIGQVLRPIEGIGRFQGSEFAEVGRIRANHAGVICISTSPLGWIGGFQIIPAGHGMSKEMKNARTLTQWMVIGPVSALDPSFEGVAPFFKYFIQPRYSENDLEQPDWKERLLGRFLVEVKYRGEDKWKPMPALYVKPGAPLPRWANTAMENVAQIRILFPIYKGS